MTDLEDENPGAEKKQQKLNSVLVAVGLAFIGISFLWNILSAFLN